MTSGDGSDEGQVGVSENGKLALLFEHARVVADHAVPFTGVVMEGKQQFPIVEVRQSRVDVPDWHQLDFPQVRSCLRDNRHRVVVVECEEGQYRLPAVYAAAATGSRFLASWASRSSASSIAAASKFG